MATLSSSGLRAFLEAFGIVHLDTQLALTDMENNPMDIYRYHLAEILIGLTNCEQQVAYKSIVWANDMSHLVVVAPRLRLKGVNSEDLAADLQQRFPTSALFAHPVNDGINLLFYFSNSNLARLLMPYVLDRGPSYGKHLLGAASALDSTELKRQKVVVEFSSPNLGKAFDGLLLRSTIIGAFIASIYESMGWDVYKINFLGDWGKHIGLLAAGWSRFGSEEAFEADPLRYLLEVYTRTNELLKEQQEAARTTREEQEDGDGPVSPEIEAEKDQCFKNLEDGDPDALALWKRFREVCILKYIELYARMGVRFDDYSGESQISKETIQEVEDTLKEKGVYKENDDGWFIEFSKPDEKGLGSVKARFRDGTTTYLLRDIAAVLERNKKYSFDKMIYVVSARQRAHFHQLFKALELMGLSDLTQRLQHFNFGDVHGLTPNEGATGLLLGDILDQCRDATKLALDTDQDTSGHFFGHDPASVADALGAMNLMADDLSTKRGSIFNLDLNKMATTGDYTGLNLQKWYTMLSSRLSGVDIDRAELESADYGIFEGEDTAYTDVLRVLIQFPGIVRSSFEKQDSIHIMTFLFNIIDILPGIWEEETEAEGSAQNLAKLALFQCLHQTMGNAMKILGLAPLTT